MVSGKTWPDGDPNLQKQNEPSVAVSTRNPMHLLAGANDYRTLDFAGLPFVEEDSVTPDAWLGVFKSFDGGATWKSTLLPGCPYNTPPGVPNPCLNSPVRGKGFNAGADPTVRSGTNGLFYYSGIAFDRNDKKNGALFVASYIDDNNKEAGDPIRYIGASIVDMNTGGQFTDKPWLAVDRQRLGAGTCTIEGPGAKRQTIPAGNVYLAYTIFLGQGQNTHTKLIVATSRDCAKTWKQEKVSEGNAINQGAALAIDPDTGAVYVAWRRFKNLGGAGQILETDTILAARSLDGGQTFSKGVPVVPAIEPFDQRTSQSQATFRTNAFPAIAAASGRVYLAWAERVGPPADAPAVQKDSRIVLYSSMGGVGWTSHGIVDNPSTPLSRGHQIMPALAFAAGKLMLLYYDLRDDHTYFRMDPMPPPNGNQFTETRVETGNLPGQPGKVFTPAVADGTPGLVRRHTLDVRIKQINIAGGSADFGVSSARVSQYMYGTPAGAPYPKEIKQLQFNPPNLALFRRGTVPFIGDYIDIAGVAFLPIGGGWVSNTASSNSEVFHAVWTDNRNVRPAKDPAKYAPPGGPASGPSVFDPSQTKPGCTPGSVPGMMNQDVYTSRIDQGLFVGSLGNAKPLSTTLKRSFSFFARNTKSECKSYRLNIVAPAGVQASFRQSGEALTTLNVTIGPRSSISRSVYALSPNKNARLEVQVRELSVAAPRPCVPGDLTAAPVNPAGLQAAVVLNPDIENPEIENPEIENPDPWSNSPVATSEVYNPEIENPEIENPEIENPEIENPEIENPEIENRMVANPGIANPEIENPEIENPEIENPEIENPEIENIPPAGQVTDVIWKVRNKGNAAASYNARLLLNQSVPPGLKLQLLVHRLYRSPVAAGCSLQYQTQNVVLTNVPSPNFTAVPDLANPEIENSALSNATFTLAPGDTAKITLRILDPDKTSGPNVCGPLPLTPCPPGVTSFNPVTAVMPVAVAQQANVNPPPHTPPPISAGGPVLIILTTALSAGAVGTPYSAFVVAGGGTAPRTWSIIGGTLPGGLQLNASTGEMFGTPTSAGTIGFTVRVQDSSVPQQSATGNLSITVVGSLPSPTANLAFTSPPTAAMRGLVISPAVQVQALRGDGAAISGLTVTLALGANPNGAILSGTLTAVTNLMGHANFGNLSLDQVGAGYTLVASAAGAPPATSNTFIVLPVRDLIVANSNAGVQVLRVSPDGSSVTTVVSSPGGCGPRIAVEASGNYVIADVCGARILRVSPAGALTVVRSGSPFLGPVAVTVDQVGNIIVGDMRTDTIYRMTPDGVTVTPLLTLNPVNPARSQGIALAVDPASGDVVVANEADGDVPGVTGLRRITPGGVVSTVFTGSQIPSVSGVAVDALGNFILTSYANNTIYSVTPPGLVTPLSGLTNNTALAGNMSGIAIDAGGNFYVTVNGVAGPPGPRLLRITPSRVIGTVAAGGLVSFPNGVVISALTGFFPTGGMTTARQSPSATVLPNGRVLVTGGGSATAEIYNPVTGAFTPAASMAAPRSGQTATLLQNGKVLIAGGGVQTAELFDPATGLFTPTGNMVIPRAFHTATLMPSGSVLLAGGADTSQPNRDTLASGEVYDPVTGAFSLMLTGMNVSRELHTATALANTQILIAGGRSGNTWAGYAFLNDAYLFDPVALSFNPLGATMTSPRAMHAAALLADGRVLLAGGFNFGSLASAEIYNPIAGTFVPTTGALATARSFHSATRLSTGKVLVLGGFAGTAGPTLASGELYDPVSRTFSAAGAMSTPRWGHSAVLLNNGQVLILGGSRGSGPLASAELYAP